MKTGTLILGGMATGVVLGVAAAVAAYTLAPPVQFPGQWSWLNNWGQIGVAAAAGWFTFVLSIVLAIFVSVAQGFNEMESGGTL